MLKVTPVFAVLFRCFDRGASTVPKVARWAVFGNARIASLVAVGCSTGWLIQSSKATSYAGCPSAKTNIAHIIRREKEMQLPHRRPPLPRLKKCTIRFASHIWIGSGMYVSSSGLLQASRPEYINHTTYILLLDSAFTHRRP